MRASVSLRRPIAPRSQGAWNPGKRDEVLLNGVLYRRNSNCERIFEVATDCLLWLAPTTI